MIDVWISPAGYYSDNNRDVFSGRLNGASVWLIVFIHGHRSRLGLRFA